MSQNQDLYCIKPNIRFSLFPKSISVNSKECDLYGLLPSDQYLLNKSRRKVQRSSKTTSFNIRDTVLVPGRTKVGNSKRMEVKRMNFGTRMCLIRLDGEFTDIVQPIRYQIYPVQVIFIVHKKDSNSLIICTLLLSFVLFVIY